MIKIISDTIQEFRGERFYLCGNYFQRHGRRLHREVWEYANKQKVPEGYHVHHKDTDRTNNQPDNLELIDGKEHISHHMQTTTDKQRAARRKNQKAAMVGNQKLTKQQRAKATKKSWENQKKKPPTVKACAWCGEDFETYRPTLAKYCNGNCRAKFLRHKKAPKN